MKNVTFHVDQWISSLICDVYIFAQDIESMSVHESFVFLIEPAINKSYIERVTAEIIVCVV